MAINAVLTFKRLSPHADDPSDCQSYENDVQTVPIHDARGEKYTSDGDISHILSLDSPGFTLMPHVSAMNDWSDEDELEATYYTEMCALIKKLTGAHHVFPAGFHVIRESPPPKNIAGSLNYVHNDFPGILKAAYEHHLGAPEPDISDWNAEEQMVLGFAADPEQQVHKSKRRKKEPHQPFDNFEHGYRIGIENQMAGLKATGVDLETLAKYRVVLLNTWRQVNTQPTNRCPLAIADKRTVTDRDGLVGRPPGRMGVVKTDLQRFYYYPDMTPSELLIFVGYDSDSHSHRPCAHSAFNIPSDAEPRKSVELRCVALIPPS